MQMSKERWASVPEVRDGSRGAIRELVLLGAALERLSTSLIPYSFDSLEHGSEDPRETLGESVFRVLEL